MFDTFCVSSTLDKDSKDYDLLTKTLANRYKMATLLPLSDAANLEEKVERLICSKALFIPAGLEVTDQLELEITVAIKMAKVVRFFSHGLKEDNPDTVEYMKERRLAIRPFGGDNDLFEEDN